MNFGSQACDLDHCCIVLTNPESQTEVASSNRQSLHDSSSSSARGMHGGCALSGS